ncbi:MAG: EamA family transporter, partial [Acidimicrobiales bacterium]
DPHTARRLDIGAVALALLAGVGFAGTFIAFGEATTASGFYPLLSARAVSVTAFLVGALIVGQPVLAKRVNLPTIAAAGLLDVTANALFLLAVREGLLSLVAVLASLYPAATVALARIVLHEAITRTQAAGLGLAAAGVLLIAVG